MLVAKHLLERVDGVWQPRDGMGTGEALVAAAVIVGSRISCRLGCRGTFRTLHPRAERAHENTSWDVSRRRATTPTRSRRAEPSSTRNYRLSRTLSASAAFRESLSLPESSSIANTFTSKASPTLMNFSMFRTLSGASSEI